MGINFNQSFAQSADHEACAFSVLNHARTKCEESRIVMHSLTGENYLSLISGCAQYQRERSCKLPYSYKMPLKQVVALRLCTLCIVSLVYGNSCANQMLWSKLVPEKFILVWNGISFIALCGFDKKLFLNGTFRPLFVMYGYLSYTCHSAQIPDEPPKWFFIQEYLCSFHISLYEICTSSFQGRAPGN